MDPRKKAVAQTGTLHFRDGDDELMYGETATGALDETKPCTAELYSPGSKEYAKAAAAQNNRMIDKLKAKGKAKQTAAEQAEEKAVFLADCTKSFSNIEIGDLEGKELFKAVYADLEIGFMADQAGAFLGDWKNFTKPSPTA